MSTVAFIERLAATCRDPRTAVGVSPVRVETGLHTRAGMGYRLATHREHHAWVSRPAPRPAPRPTLPPIASQGQTRRCRYPRRVLRNQPNQPFPQPRPAVRPDDHLNRRRMPAASTRHTTHRRNHDDALILKGGQRAIYRMISIFSRRRSVCRLKPRRSAPAMSNMPTSSGSLPIRARPSR